MRRVHRFSALRAGVLGLGRVGWAVAERLRGLGLTVAAYDPYVSEPAVPLLELDQLLAEADLISVHLPLNDETRGMLSRPQLELLPRGAVLVNVARGGIVDELALTELLESGHLGGAGLDVFEDEPLDAASPMRSLENVILTPHVAWYSQEAVRELQAKVAVQAVRALRGERLRPVVNDAVYD